MLSRRGHGSWYFTLGLRTVGGGARRLRRGGYATRAEARRALARLRSAKTSRHGALTVAEWLTTWLDSRTSLRASTRRNYRSHLANHLIPLLGGVLLAELDLPQLQNAFTALHQRVSAVTLHRVRAALRTALNAAMRAGVIADNPARLIELPATRRPHPVVWTAERIRAWQCTGIRPAVAIWTAEQTAAFLAHIRDHRLYAAFHVIALRGLRRGEAAAGLRWYDVDLAGARLTVTQQLQRHDGQLIAGPPKSRASVRTIALDPDTVAGPRTPPTPKRRAGRRRKSLAGRWLRLHPSRWQTTRTGDPHRAPARAEHRRRAAAGTAA
jgi:hypothetical protein